MKLERFLLKVRALFSFISIINRFGVLDIRLILDLTCLSNFTNFVSQNTGYALPPTYLHIQTPQNYGEQSIWNRYGK